MRARLAALATGLLILAGLPQTAASAEIAQISQAQAVTAHFTPAEAAQFSKQIERDLAARGARVAMVFRTGRSRDDLPDGIAYTHGAFWVHRAIATPQGETLSGYAVYNLYAGDGKAWPKTESRLMQDWPLDFTRGSAVDDVAVVIPSRELQMRLMAVIDSPTYARMHNPAYSLVANPMEQKYQNCTTFMLDVIGAALWQTDDPVRIRADLRAYFTPAIVRPDPLTRLFGPLFDARLRTGDQHGEIRTATYESMAAFLGRYEQMEAAYALTFDRGV